MPFLVLSFLSGELIISGPCHLKLIPLSSQRQMNRIQYLRPVLCLCLALLVWAWAVPGAAVAAALMDTGVA